MANSGRVIYFSDAPPYRLTHFCILPSILTVEHPTRPAAHPPCIQAHGRNPHARARARIRERLSACQRPREEEYLVIVARSESNGR